MTGAGRARLLQLLRRADQQSGALRLPLPRHRPLATIAQSTQPERRRDLTPGALSNGRPYRDRPIREFSMGYGRFKGKNIAAACALLRTSSLSRGPPRARQSLPCRPRFPSRRDDGLSKTISCHRSRQTSGTDGEQRSRTGPRRSLVGQWRSRPSRPTRDKTVRRRLASFCSSVAFSCTCCPAASTASATTACSPEPFARATSSAPANCSPPPRSRPPRQTATPKHLPQRADARVAAAG